MGECMNIGWKITQLTVLHSFSAFKSKKLVLW